MYICRPKEYSLDRRTPIVDPGLFRKTFSVLDLFDLMIHMSYRSFCTRISSTAEPTSGATSECDPFLLQFYNPKLYKAPPKRELSSGDRIYENLGGEITTAAPGGIAGTGIQAFLQLGARQADAPAPPPETAAAYMKKSEESGGVMAMMDLLTADLEKEMTVAETEEKDAQQDYEKMMQESADKRASDSKALTDKEAAKADLQSALETTKAEKKGTKSELMATAQYIASLHGECDWLLQYFDVRKQARADEVDSLTKAKAVLSGADYSLLQRGEHSARARKFRLRGA